MRIIFSFLIYFTPLSKIGQVYLTYLFDGAKHQYKINNIRVYIEISI